MALPDLMDLIRHDPRSTMALRAVAGETEGKIPDVETLWRKPVWSVESSGVAQSGKWSLEDIIDRNRSILLVDDGAGGQPVDVIFSSLIILTTETLPGSAAFVKFLTDRILQRFGGVMEDNASVDIQLGVTRASDHPITLFLGSGIFAAPMAQAPQGSVEIIAADGENVGEPRIAGATAAGLYPQQSSLAFSRSERFSPAVHPDLPADVLFCLGQNSLRKGGGSASALPALQALPCSSEPDATSIEVEVLPQESDADCDIRFAVTGIRPQRGRVRVCSVDVTLDTRPSRMHLQRPAGSLVLAVAGVALRESYGGRRIARYWLDRTIGGGMRFSRMLAERDSMVVQGRALRIYRRAEMRYERRVDAAFAVERLSFEGERRSLLLTSGAPFGYLRPPQQTLACYVRPVGAAAWSLDWIGNAVTVQFSSGETGRLDALYDAEPLGIIGLGTEGLLTQGGADLWSIEAGQAKPAGKQEWKPGSRLVIGPLVLDVVGPG